MSKLFKLKEWLTLKEAANHLSTVLGEPVIEADLYRLTLDRHLTLSANFVNGSQARLGKKVKINDVKFNIMENDFITGEELDIPIEFASNHELRIDESPDSDFLYFEKEVKSIRGVWDLTMLGSEAIDVEFYYQQMTSGLEVTLVGLEGVFLEKGSVVASLQTDYDDNEYQRGSKAAKKNLDTYLLNNKFSDEKVLELLEEYKQDRLKFIDDRKDKPKENNYFPSGGLDEHDYILVVRTNEMTRFIQSLEDTPQEIKPLTSKERNSLLVLLGAICKSSDIDVNKRGISTSLVAMTELIGAPLSDDTIRKILNQIESAIDLRSN